MIFPGRMDQVLLEILAFLAVGERFGLGTGSLLEGVIENGVRSDPM
jgi:hypothetical protein